MGAVNITVNGAGGAPVDTAREVKRVVRDALREQSRVIDKMARSEGVAQQ